MFRVGYRQSILAVTASVIGSRERGCRQAPVLALLLTLLLTGSGRAVGAVIPVTTLEQKISDVSDSTQPGCSLQEAIFSANFDNNIAILRYGSGGTPTIVITNCVPGSGDDIISLPTGATFQLKKVVDDADNAAGPAATPMVTSNITILAGGSTLQRTGGVPFRLFVVGPTGHLTIRNAFIKGFLARGGEGGDNVLLRSGIQDGGGGGGGGGMGAGGAIYVWNGGLVIENSTFQSNQALGGRGGRQDPAATSIGNDGGGGGGGIGGNGGGGACGEHGGGGGGARGDGTGGSCGGGGGGGTVSTGFFSSAIGAFAGGVACGGDGGNNNHGDGHDAPCAGGGGGGGTLSGLNLFSGNGGSGNYGGGGGGGAEGGGNGGRGGFGGGGGGGWADNAFGASGGNGGFGGGGGAGPGGIITDGDPGSGGMFAGGGKAHLGGGGAGLGGAIFNDSGSIVIRNSTFSANVAFGGAGAATQGSAAQEGSGSGGAIFSRNGHLNILNATISGNSAAIGIGGGVLLVQDSASAPTSFILENTIIANNGPKECGIAGFTISGTFLGNLIQNNADGSAFRGTTFTACPGVVSSADPQLGTLQNNQGDTPTMAISANSPARNAADTGTSLPADQRGQTRPASGGFDIGAVELCFKGPEIFQMACLINRGILEGQRVTLTLQVSPSGGGTTSPAVGAVDEAQYSVIPLKTTPNAGFRFTNWSSNVIAPANPITTVFMDQSKTVTANFAACACATDVSSSIGITLGGFVVNPITKRWVQTVTLKNNSAATITPPISLVLDNLSNNATLFNATGSTALMLPAGSPYFDANINLAAGQSTTVTLQFTNPSNTAITYDTRVLAGAGTR